MLDEVVPFLLPIVYKAVTVTQSVPRLQSYCALLLIFTFHEQIEDCHDGRRAGPEVGRDVAVLVFQG